MIAARMQNIHDGSRGALIALTMADVERLMGGGLIEVPMAELGWDVTVTLMSGASDAELIKTLNPLAGPDIAKSGSDRVTRRQISLT